MGHIIERIALERGNTITCRIDRDNPGDFDSEAFLSSDVAIEFSTPGTAPDNLLRCFRRGIPVVCGTTGWTARLDEFRQLCDVERALCYGPLISLSASICSAQSAAASPA